MSQSHHTKLEINIKIKRLTFTIKSELTHPAIRTVMTNPNQLVPLVRSGHHSTSCLHLSLSLSPLKMSQSDSRFLRIREISTRSQVANRSNYKKPGQMRWAHPQSQLNSTLPSQLSISLSSPSVSLSFSLNTRRFLFSVGFII